MLGGVSMQRAMRSRPSHAALYHLVPVEVSSAWPVGCIHRQGQTGWHRNRVRQRSDAPLLPVIECGGRLCPFQSGRFVGVGGGEKPVEPVDIVGQSLFRDATLDGGIGEPIADCDDSNFADAVRLEIKAC